MDEAVRQAMARWPNVPDVFGWLSLDRRGRWCLQGEVIAHPGVVAFIGRNYQSDPLGRWFFQNGPQRVFVSLSYAPWVYRSDGDGGFETHTGRSVTALSRVLSDEQGNVLLLTEHGAGLLEDRDLAALAGRIRDDGAEPSTLSFVSDFGVMPMEPIHSGQVARTFGYESDPQPVD
jgi:hypothetical protein